MKEFRDHYSSWENDVAHLMEAFELSRHDGFVWSDIVERAPRLVADEPKDKEACAEVATAAFQESLATTLRDGLDWLGKWDTEAPWRPQLSSIAEI